MYPVKIGGGVPPPSSTAGKIPEGAPGAPHPHPPRTAYESI